MKKTLALILTLACMLTGLTPALAQADDAVALNLLSLYEADPTAFNCINTGTFLPDASSAPSDAELTRMLDFSMSIGSAHSLTPAHMIVIRDYDEQQNILGVMGENTVTPGTVTVLVLTDTVRAQAHHAEPYGDWYSQMYYGIFDAGSAMGYLNLAANALGYKTHFYAALNIPVDGVTDLTHGGRFELIQQNNWDIEKYTTSKDGTARFGHGIGLYDFATGPKEIAAEGNLSLMCAVVIGRVDESLDAVSAATQAFKPRNYNFWDPEDGASYGLTAPTDAGVPVDPWAALADGQYSGTGSSTSSEYTVVATVKAGAIDAIEITEGRENMFAGDEALGAFIAAIIENQSLAVDAVSGATQDCQGIVAALNEAFQG